MPRTARETPLADACRALLTARWATLEAEPSRALEPKGEFEPVALDLVGAIMGEGVRDTRGRRGRGGGTTYRVALATQVLAKAARPALDPRCIQASWAQVEPEARFDARSLSSEVILAWDHTHSGALGAKRDTYTNGPVKHREAFVSIAHRGDPASDEAVCQVLGMIQSGIVRAQVILDGVLLGWITRWRDKQAALALCAAPPVRMPLGDLLAVVDEFVGGDRDGRRAQAAVAAAADAQRACGLIRAVASAHHTAADASTGHGADVVYEAPGTGTRTGIEVRGRGRHVSGDEAWASAEKAARAGLGCLLIVSVARVSADLSALERQALAELGVAVRGFSLEDWLSAALVDPAVQERFLGQLTRRLSEATDLEALAAMLGDGPGKDQSHGSHEPTPLPVAEPAALVTG